MWNVRVMLGRQFLRLSCVACCIYVIPQAYCTYSADNVYEKVTQEPYQN
jgi:hypothetical protein